MQCATPIGVHCIAQSRTAGCSNERLLLVLASSRGGAIANGATCVDCGSRRNLEGDHELAVSRGGLSTRANLAIRCRKHNRAKGNRIVRYQLHIPWPVAGGGSATGWRSGSPAPALHHAHL